MTDKDEGPGVPMKDLPQETQDKIKATVDNLLKGRPGVEIRIKQGQGPVTKRLRDTIVIDDEDKK